LLERNLNFYSLHLCYYLITNLLFTKNFKIFSFFTIVSQYLPDFGNRLAIKAYAKIYSKIRIVILKSPVGDKTIFMVKERRQKSQKCLLKAMKNDKKRLRETL